MKSDFRSAQPAQHSAPCCREIIHQTFLSMTLSPRSVEIMFNSLYNNTYKQYNGCIKSWIEYCYKHDDDCNKASVPIVIIFLSEMYDRGAQYGTINSYKSALSLLFNDVLNDSRIKRFMKGVFRLKPT